MWRGSVALLVTFALLVLAPTIGPTAAADLPVHHAALRSDDDGGDRGDDRRHGHDE
jgi:hypothetical protein